MTQPNCLCIHQFYANLFAVVPVSVNTSLWLCRFHVCLPACLSVCSTVCANIYLSVSALVSVYLCLSLYLPLCLPV